MEENEKVTTDEEILFPEVKVKAKFVDGSEKEYEIKPWSFGELKSINPILENIFTEMESRGTTIDLEDFNFKTIKNIYFSAMASLGELILSSTDMTEDELNRLTVESAADVGLALFNTNKGSIAYFFSLFFAQTGPEGSEEVKTKTQ